MALQSLNTLLRWPLTLIGSGGTPAAAALATLDAAGEYLAFVAVAERDMVISHIGFRPGTVSGSPTADVRIETIDASGIPTGTLWATNTNAVTATLVSNTWALTALTASATIARGQLFCVKIVYNSGTSLTVVGFGSTGIFIFRPYLVTNTTGSAVKSNVGLAAVPAIALGSSATTFYPQSGLMPGMTVNTVTFNNTSGAKRGARFQVPFKCECAGLLTRPGAATGDYNVLLMDDAGAELSSSNTAVDGDTNGGGLGGAAFNPFDSPVILSPGTWYRAAQEPTSATNISMFTMTLPSLNYRSAWPGGTNFFYATFASGSWTDTATDTVPLIDLLMSALEDGVGGSGIVQRVNSGGLVG